MRRPYLSMSAIFVVMVWGAVDPGAQSQTQPEPEGFRLDNFRAPTPPTLKGATVIGTAEAEAIWRKGGVAFIDVLPQPMKPANLPAGTVWHAPTRDTIPSSIWLPNVGFGDLSPEAEAYFQQGLSVASKDDLSHPLVFFCLRNCWMSWNAAKRALSYKYSTVYWYPEGTDGWTDAGLPLARAEKSP